MASYTADAIRIFEALQKYRRGETGAPYGHFLTPQRFMGRIDHIDVFPDPERDAPGRVFVVVRIIGREDPTRRIGVGWPNYCNCIDLIDALLDRIETFE